MPRSTRPYNPHMRRLEGKLLLIAWSAALAVAPPSRAEEARTRRLEALCRVWAAAKYVHPAMLTREIDWDGALMRAIPRVRDAATDVDLAGAIGGMLGELGDPVTRVCPPRSKNPGREAPLIREDGEVLVLSLGPAVERDSYVLWAQGREITEAVEKARLAVVDLTTSDPDAAEALSEFLDGASLWTSRPLVGTPSWTPFYSGFAPQHGPSSGGYYAALMLRAGTAISPAKSAPNRLAFVTDGAMPLPSPVVALWRAGAAAIVSSSPVTDASSVRRVPMPGGYEARIRSGEFAVTSIAADLVSPVPLEAAMKLVRGLDPIRPHEAPLRPTPAAHGLVEPAYPEMLAPDLPHRLLAAFRIWSTIQYFYPYRALIGDWDAVLREFIPRFEDAETEQAYVQAVLEMTARVEDGHTSRAGHPGLQAIVPDGIVPFLVDRIEGQPVIIEKDLPAAPVSPGEVVVSIDGEPFEAKIRGLWKFITAATEPARMARVMNAALRGPVGSVARLGLRGSDGRVRTVDVPRVATMPRPTGDSPWRVLEGNIGYADLARLTVSQVDPMFDALTKTKAIIFDMRGYPNGTAWSIAPRINTRHATVAALFRRRQISGASTPDEADAGYFFEQAMPTTDKPLYTGKIVVLIDDRAISQAEHTCLFFEQAAGATFIGTPTAGSNGDVTNFTLPGGFVVYFTGHDVRHADGRELQRVGIQPDIRVAPTIAGLQAGRDEVLERAVAYVNGLKP